MQTTTTDAEIDIREATLDDVDALNKLENACFDTDRISRRSFRWMIEKGHSLLLVALVDQQLVGYVLLLYSKGTSWAGSIRWRWMPVIARPVSPPS